MGSQTHFFLTGVYGGNLREERQALWVSLKDFSLDQDCPWILLGDFDSIRHPREKRGRIDGPSSHSEDFNKFISECGLTEPRLQGSVFTWSKKVVGQDRIVCRLGRAPIIWDFFQLCPTMQLITLNPGISDHSPILLHFDRFQPRGNKPFHFRNALTMKDGFLEVVKEAWGTRVFGKIFFLVVEKLKAVTVALKWEWEYRNKGYSGEGGSIQSSVCSSNPPRYVGLEERERCFKRT